MIGGVAQAATLLKTTAAAATSFASGTAPTANTAATATATTTTVLPVLRTRVMRARCSIYHKH